MTKQDIIKDIYAQLVNIYFTAKNLHWFSKTYGNHLLFDRIADGILDHVDTLIEVGLMHANDYYALPVITQNVEPTKDELILKLDKMLCDLRDALASVQGTFSEAVANELNAISQDIQVKIRLLSMVD